MGYLHILVSFEGEASITDKLPYQFPHCRARFWPWSLPTTLSSSKSHLFPTRTIGTCCRGYDNIPVIITRLCFYTSLEQVIMSTIPSHTGLYSIPVIINNLSLSITWHHQFTVRLILRKEEVGGCHIIEGSTQSLNTWNLLGAGSSSFTIICLLSFRLMQDLHSTHYFCG